MNTKKIVAYCILALIILVGTSVGIWYYYKMKQPMIDAFGTIPNNSAIILKINDLSQTWEKVKKEGGILDKLMKQEFLQSEVETIDSMFLKIQNIPSFKNFLNQNPLFISFHFAGNDNFDVLYTMSINPPYDNSEIQRDLSKLGSITERTFKDLSIYCISTLSQQKLYFVFYGGVLSISKSDLLIEKVILNIKETKRNTSEKALDIKMLKMSGNDATISIYLNYRFAYRFISKYANNDFIDFVSLAGGISEKASFDMEVNDNLLMLNGFSFSYDSIPTLMSALRTQSPKEINTDQVLPKDIVFISTLTFDNFEILNTELEKSKFKLQNTTAINDFTSAFGVKLGDYFYNWMNSELTLAVNKTSYENIEKNTFCLLKATDIKEAENKLIELGKIIASKQMIFDDTLGYKNFVIRNLHSENIISNLFGSVFKPIKNSFYVAIGDYIVFGSNVESLKNYLQEIELDNTLHKNSNYSNFSNNLSKKASYFLYSNLSASSDLIKYFVKPEIANKLNNNLIPLTNFDGFAIQFVCEPEGDYTNLVLAYKSNEQQENVYNWQLSLDDEIYGEVNYFVNSETKVQKYLVFDRLKNAYQISNTGTIDWKIPMAELPIGKVFMIDYFKNGKTQYVYNSANYLYMIDSDGNRVGNYPIKLPIIATGSIHLIELDNNRNYRLLIPLEDKKIHCFGSEGKEIKEWIKPTTKNMVLSKIQYFKNGNDESIVCSDTLGNIQLLTRKGEIKNQAGTLFIKNNYSDFYKISISKKQYLLTSDKIGRLIFIDTKGKVEKKKLLDISENYKFVFLDVNENGSKDYVFITSKRIIAFTQNDEKIIDFNFGDEINLKTVEIIDFSSKSPIILAQFVKNNQIIFFSTTGNPIDFQIDVSTKNFYLNQATLTNEMYLITTVGKVLNNYKFRE